MDEILLPVRDRSFRLTDADRAQLLPALDVNAVEEFLSWFPATVRPDVFLHFYPPHPDYYVVELEIHTNRPDIRALVDRINAGLRTYQRKPGR